MKEEMKIKLEEMKKNTNERLEELNKLKYPYQAKILERIKMSIHDILIGVIPAEDENQLTILEEGLSHLDDAMSCFIEMKNYEGDLLFHMTHSIFSYATSYLEIEEE